MRSSNFRAVLHLSAFLLVAARLAGAAPTVIYSLTGDADGAFPHASLAASTDGSLYGTTTSGGSALGAAGNGTVFKVTAGGTLTTLYAFPAGGTKGVAPNNLVLGSDGNLYGTTASGGSDGFGTVFKMTVAGALTTLYTFTDGNDGASPNGIVVATDGNLYGTTGSGGPGGYGTAFKLTAGGALTTLYAFTGGSDGASPQAALIQAADGNLYGTTCYGGSGSGYAGFGTLFVVTTGGALTTLYTFTGAADGAYPYGAVVQSSAGDLYGTTSASATGVNRGTVFKLTTTGAFTTLHAFTGGSDGDGPTGGLVEASDGSLYGATHTAGTTSSGTTADGTLFSVTSGGTFATLATFSGAGTGAFTPYAALAVGSDGNLYGSTVNGGTNDRGTIFQQVIAAITTTAGSGTLQFSAATFTASESAGTATGTVTRAGGSTGAVSVAYAATAGTALAGTDFTPASGTLTWADGDAASKTFSVSVLDDTASTANHTVVLTLSGAAGGAALGGTSSSVLVITDTASATLPTVNIVARGDGYLVNGGENGKALVTRTGDTSAALTVYYQVKGTAGNGTDYVGTDGVALDGSVVVPAGETQVKLKVKALTTPARRETVKIVLQADPSGSYVLGTQTKVKLLLVNPGTFQF